MRMTVSKNKAKYILCKQHRITWYLREFDLLLQGLSTPDRVEARYKKVKAVI